jgi:hypothetical protein
MISEFPLSATGTGISERNTALYCDRETLDHRRKLMGFQHDRPLNIGIFKKVDLEAPEVTKEKPSGRTKELTQNTERS